MGREAIVYVQNMPAGLIRETDEGYEFSYDSAYLEKEAPVPVSLTLPLTREIYKSRFLFPFFDGLIPDGLPHSGIPHILR